MSRAGGALSLSATRDPLTIPVLSAANFVVGMGAFMVIGMLPPLAEGLSLGTARAGWIMTIYALAFAVASPVLISVTGRVGRRKVLAAGMALFALANLIAMLAPDAGWLFAARALAAVGAGLTTPVAAAVAAASSAPERRARSLAAVFFGLTLAQVVGVPAGGFIAYTLGWRAAFGLVALLALPCLWLIWTHVPRGLAFQSVGLRDLGRTLLDPAAMLAVSFTATFLAAIHVVYTYTAPILEAQMGFGRDGVTLALLVFGAGAVVGNQIGGLMADRLGPYRTLMILALAQVVLLPVFSTLPVPAWLLLLYMFLWSVLGWSFTAPQQARMVVLAPDRAGVVLALNAAAIYVGTALGSGIGGAVLERFGLASLGLAGGMVAVVSVANLAISRRGNL